VKNEQCSRFMEEADHKESSERLNSFSSKHIEIQTKSAKFK
jgi:hypothetical protein